MDSKIFLLLLITLAGRTPQISGRCYVLLTEYPNLRPTLHRQIGSRTAVISTEEQRITFEENEQISAFCETRFKIPAANENESVINLKCNSNQIEGYYTNGLSLECDSMKWNLYESSAPFKWCPPFSVSYILARPSGSGYEYLAGICYNFNTMTIQSLYYTMATISSMNRYPTRLRNYKPSVEIPNFATTFEARKITFGFYDDPQLMKWREFANYQNHSIMQNNHLYYDSYNKFGGLLEFAWWPALRLANWRRYEVALRQHVEQDDLAYDIVAGISGTVTAPIYKEICQQNLTLVELANEKSRKLPLYVWHYLKSSKSDKDNLVVIGVNSPFHEFHNESELVFCTDICSQIPWLQKVQTTFHYKTMGRVFCCSVNEVRASKRLTGFPLGPKTVTPLSPPLPVIHPQQNYDDFEEPKPIENQGEIHENELTNEYDV